MKYLKYLIISVIFILPIEIKALESSSVLECDKSILSVNETTTCNLNVNVTSGGLKGFIGTIDVGSNMEISDISISKDWTNNSTDNNINIKNDNAKDNQFSLITFKVKAISVVPETTEIIKISNISVIDENEGSLNKPDLTKSIRIPSNNASLTEITLSVGSLSEQFDPNKLEYYIDKVDSDTITISAKANANASISGLGIKNLKYGENANKFEIVVKAEAGNSKTYIIYVTRKDNRSNDSTLRQIKINDELIQFSSNKNSYRVELSSDSEKFKISAEPNNDKAEIEYSANDVSLSLDETYTIVITVTAENGSKSYYRVTATRKDNRSSNNTLKELIVNNERISLSNLQSYTKTVSNSVNSANISASAKDSKAKIEISGNKNLKIGSNNFTITVTAENGDIKTYKLTIIRKNEDGEVTNHSNNNFLKNLKIVNYEIDFNKEKYVYNLEVENNITKLDIKYELEDNKATAVLEGNSSLKEGDNVISILVTAENGETSIYTINVTRKIKSNEVENNKDKIIAALNNENGYEQVIVKVKDSNNLIIQNDIIKTIINSKKKITYYVLNNSNVIYGIVVNGSLFDKYDGDINYKVLLNSTNEKLNSLIENKKNIVLNFSHSGDLPTGTLFYVNVKNTFEDGSNLYLYYYDENEELKLNKENLVVNSGYVSIPLDHCSTYILLDSKIEEIKPSEVPPLIEENKDSGINMLYIYIAMGILLLIGIIFIILSIRKKKTPKNKSEKTVIKENNIPVPSIDNSKNLERTEIIDIFEISNEINNIEYLFGISVMDIGDYLNKAPLSGLKNENIKEGIVIVSMEKDSPLLSAGISQGDVLIEFNNNRIVNKETFKVLTSNLKRGSNCILKYYNNGKEKSIQVTI